MNALKQNALFINALYVLSYRRKVQGIWLTAKMRLIPYLPCALRLVPWAFFYIDSITGFSV